MGNRIKQLVRAYFELSKFTISISVSITALTGFILKSNSFSAPIFFLVTGVFFLSVGSSALNHYQERAFDPLMNRTKSRPLPMGTVSPDSALLFSIVLLLAGSIFLLKSGVPAFLLGILTVIWYNLIYTYLKRFTAFAVVPGAMVGAIPPIIGWVAAGGDLRNYPIMVLAFFFFMGQIPHFWLILLKFGKEYEGAGFPSLSQVFTQVQIKRLTFVWIVAVGISSLLFLLTGIIRSFWIGGLMILLSGTLIVTFSKMVFSEPSTFKFGRAFMNLNIYFLAIMILLIVNSLVF